MRRIRRDADDDRVDNRRVERDPVDRRTAPFGELPAPTVQRNRAGVFAGGDQLSDQGIAVEYFQILRRKATHEGEAFVLSPVPQQSRKPLDGGLFERQLSIPARLQKIPV